MDFKTKILQRVATLKAEYDEFQKIAQARAIQYETAIRELDRLLAESENEEDLATIEEMKPE